MFAAASLGLENAGHDQEEVGVLLKSSGELINGFQEGLVMVGGYLGLAVFKGIAALFKLVP
jgi:hypothetical protein